MGYSALAERVYVQLPDLAAGVLLFEKERPVEPVVGEPLLSDFEAMATAN